MRKKLKDKVVIISVFKPEILGGVATHSTELAKRLIQDGFQVEKIDLNIIFKTKYRLGIFLSISKICFLLVRYRILGYNIFHFHISKKGLIYYLFLPLIRLMGSCVILSIHSGDYINWLKTKKILIAVNWLYFRLTNRIVFMNLNQANECRKMLALNFEKCLNISPYIAANENLEDYYAFGNTLPLLPFRIAVMGLWDPNYNYEEVMSVLKPIASTNAIELTLIVSTSNQREEYRAKIMKLIEQNSVIYPIVLIENCKLLNSVLSNHHLLIRSAIHDSFGLCVAEALALGVPVIATTACIRCKNTMLYNSGDTNALGNSIMSVINSYPRKRNSLLELEEDSYFDLKRIYHAIKNKK